MLEQVAYFQNRRDEVPNQELAARLAASGDARGVHEIVEGLGHPVEAVRSDCIKVLYELGELAPEMIAGYVDVFLDLLGSRNNRLVWGGMSALATVAALKAQELYARRDEIERAIERGSVITCDRGIRALAGVGAHSGAYGDAVMPFLLRHLESCRSKDVPQRAESASAAVSGRWRKPFAELLRTRVPEFTPPQLRRIRRLLGEFGAD